MISIVYEIPDLFQTLVQQWQASQSNASAGQKMMSPTRQEHRLPTTLFHYTIHEYTLMCMLAQISMYTMTKKKKKKKTLKNMYESEEKH